GPFACLPQRRSGDRAPASLADAPRWECPDPSPTPAAPGHRWSRCAAETPAGWCDPTYCPSALHRRGETRRASPPGRSPTASNPVFRPGCSPAGPSDSAPSRLRSRYWSSRTAALRNRRYTVPPTSALTTQTTPACGPALDPGSDTNGPFRRRRSPSPVTHPWRCRQTTGDVCETHCQGRPVDSPPAGAALFPNSLPPDLPVTVPAKTHPTPVVATTRMPTSSCRTSVVVATPTRSTSPARYPTHLQHSPGPP